MEKPLSRIRIVLVEPSGGLNVGSVARIMKNMGLQQLVLVRPQCDPLGAEARQMAVRAADVLTAARQVDSLAAALAGCQRVIATTGQPHLTLQGPIESPRVALPWLLPSLDNRVDPIDPINQPLDPPSPSALVFGREDRGLTIAELHLAQRWVQIASEPVYSSLNLAQAVAICCYELQQAASQLPLGANPDLSTIPETAPPRPAQPDSMPDRPAAIAPSPIGELATFDQIDRYCHQLEAFLLKIEYLYPHTATRRMQKFRLLLNRARPTAAELALLRGMVSQAEWALQQSQPDSRQATSCPPEPSSDD